MSPEDSRLNTIEKAVDGINSKLDKLAEMIVTIARVEERMASVVASVQTTNARLGHCEDAIREVQKNTSMRLIERLIWIVISLTLAAVVGKFA